MCLANVVWADRCQMHMRLSTILCAGQPVSRSRWLVLASANKIHAVDQSDDGSRPDASKPSHCIFVCVEQKRARTVMLAAEHRVAIPAADRQTPPICRVIPGRLRNHTPKIPSYISPGAIN